jgi:hypothetical protein
MWVIFPRMVGFSQAHAHARELKSTQNNLPPDAQVTSQSCEPAGYGV